MAEMSGALTWEEFVCASNGLITISDHLKDGWEWVQIPEKSSPGESYLRKKELRMANGELSTWEYHILFSPSYSTPVLYFNVSDPNGRFLGLDRVVSLLNLPPGLVLGNHLNVVSQTEHPILRKPYCYLHPCHTRELLATLIKPANVVISWLSLVGPVVGLTISLEYADSAAGT